MIGNFARMPDYSTIPLGGGNIPASSTVGGNQFLRSGAASMGLGGAGLPGGATDLNLALDNPLPDHERYVGNLPKGISLQQLTDFLNKAANMIGVGSATRKPVVE